ncbi:MAG TPA: fructosamine kinase family protein, partial [Mycobacteriales bacterium]|nr:fructosamine kinase family protein [Mycobacteriales bacterium]
PPLPEVIAVGDDGLVLEWVEPGRPSPAAAEQFGRSLATLHRDGAGDRYGADAAGFIGRRPLDNTPTGDWPEFYRQRRLAPYLAAAVDRHAMADDDRRAVETVMDRLPDLAGPTEPPARIHGDLWSGNLLWGADGAVWLIDAAAAHDGHRETDLAMLALFGAPHLDAIVAAYDAVAPLAAGWRERVPLHQLHPLLIHAAHFGGHYGAAAGAAARAMLR